MNDTYKIRSIGGALLVTIPQHIARQMQLEAGDEVVIKAIGFADVGRPATITVKPVKPSTNRKAGK